MKGNTKSSKEIKPVNDGSTALTIINWIFGTIFFAIGVVNTFWGNDLGFGVFILLLSLIYFFPVNAIFQKMFKFSIPVKPVKILVGIFILWSAMGVGELPDKIELMRNAF